MKATIFDVHLGNFSQRNLGYWVKERSGLIPSLAIESDNQKAEGHIVVGEW